jgi:hypothetical protein
MGAGPPPDLTQIMLPQLARDYAQSTFNENCKIEIFERGN